MTDYELPANSHHYHAYITKSYVEPHNYSVTILKIQFKNSKNIPVIYIKIYHVHTGKVHKNSILKCPKKE